MDEDVRSFTVETEVTESLLRGFIDFMVKEYIGRSPQDFENVRRHKLEEVEILEFDAKTPLRDWRIETKIEVKKSISVFLTLVGDVPEDSVDRLRDDIIIGVQYFEEEIRGRTLYLAFSPQEQVNLVHKPGGRGRLGHIFGDSMVNFFIISIFFSMAFYLVFGVLTPLIMIAFQSLIIAFSDRIVLRMGDWTLTETNPTLHLLQYHLDSEEMKDFENVIDDKILRQMKYEIFAATFEAGRKITCETAHPIFMRYGIKCRPENMLVKEVNVYELVEKASKLFSLPTPKITVSNTMISNAAATGISPGRATVLISTGAMVQLEEDELLSVIAHEMSHIKSRDPLSLFILTSTEYLLRVYVLYPLLLLLGYFYLLFALGGIYFIGKFFEARCDLESAIMTGSPRPMASALRKIGFRRLLFERSPHVRLMEWLSWDPHPPIYFRISRLEKIRDVNEIRNPFLTSIKDCLQGLVSSISPSQ